MKSKNSHSHSARGPNWRVVLLCAATLGFELPASAAPNARQSTLLVNNCTQCHARPDTGAPFIGVAQDWQDAVARGEDAMLINVVQGIRGMPPLGYCSACTEEDFRVLIRMMAGIPDPEGEPE
jgi:cytochrome c5